MKLLVTIPALNEERTIASVIRQIPRKIDAIDDVQILVLDDASTDRTRQFAIDAGARVVTLKGRLGLGRSFRTAMRLALEAGADVIVNVDGDGQFDAACIPALIRPILDNQADFVTCVRFQPGAVRRDMALTKLAGNYGVTWFVNRVTGLSLADVSCGFRAYNREAACRLQQFGRWTYVEECILDLAHKGMRMAQVHLPVRGTREHGPSRLAASVFRYGRHLAPILGLTLRDQWPLLVFGVPAIACAVMALLCFVLTSWLIGLLLCALGVIFFFASLLGDMIRRHRIVDEELLFLSRRYAEAASKPAIFRVDATADLARTTADITASTSIASMQ